ncbi:unnamed protein product, partial [Allacma fusca]
MPPIFPWRRNWSWLFVEITSSFLL